MARRVLTGEILEKYYKTLKKRWKAKKNIIEIEQEGFQEVKRGKLLYYKCQDEDVNMDIIVTPQSFKNGCYHELADQRQIGWHPNYNEKLKEDEKDV